MRPHVSLTAAALLALASPASGAESDAPTLVFQAAPFVQGPTLRPKRAVGDFKANTLLISDFDGDGVPDAAAANSFDDSVSIYRGRGDGTFALHCTASVARRPIGLVSGDWDQDARVDLAVTSYNGQGVAVLVNDGRGCVRQAGFAAGGHSPQAVTVGDWNRDGRTDLAISNRNDHNVSVLVGTGAGTFESASSSSSISVGKFPSGIVAGDWNNDDLADLAVVNHYGHSVSLLLGDGRGQFTAHATIGVGLFPGDIDSADFNGDGRSDLVAVNVRNNDLSVLVGRGDGTFSSTARLPTGRAPAGVAVGDLDFDGRADIAVVMRDAAEVMVFRNQSGGEAAFHPPLLFATKAKPIDVAIADLDRDGSEDLIVYFPAEPALQALLNRTPRPAATRRASD